MDKEKWLNFIKELENKWVGRLTPDNTKIVRVYVERLENRQHMNRVEDEYGNIYSIDELERDNRSDFAIIESTQKAQDEYGHCYGSSTLKISKEDIAALLNR